MFQQQVSALRFSTFVIFGLELKL